MVVSPSEQNPAMVAFMNYLIRPDSEKQSVLTQALYYEDTLTSIDEASNADPYAADKPNLGLKKRAQLMALSKEIRLMGDIPFVPAISDRLLLPGVKMQFTLDLHNMSFFTMSPEAENTFAFIITEAAILVERVRLAPSIALAQATQLQNRNAIYPCNPLIMTYMKNIPANSWSFQI